MELKTIKFDSKRLDYEGNLEDYVSEWTFVNEIWETSRAWGHRSVLMHNGVQYAENKVRYYNRTWEEYRYKSCMSDCVYKLLKERYNALLEMYKFKNDVVRLSQKKREDFENTMLAEDLMYQEYKKLKECL